MLIVNKKYTTTQTGDTLLAKGTANKHGRVNKVLITNSDASAKTRVVLYLDDELGGAQSIFEIVHTVIPPRTTLVLTDNLGFNNKVHALKLKLLDAGYDITVIIK